MDEYREASLYDEKDTGGGTPPEEAETAVLHDTEVLRGVSDAATDEDAGSSRRGRSHRRRNIGIAVAVAAVVVLGCGAGGYAYAASNVQRGVDSAQANAQAVDRRLTEKIAEARELLDGTDKGQVADEAVITALSDAIDEADALSGVDAAGANRWLIWQEMDAQAAYDADSADASDAMSRLDKAMDAVIGPMDAKTLADAKAALQSTVDSADKTYTDADGKVQDNATRDSLKTALDAAKKVLADDGVTDAKEYTDQKTAVDDAVKTVNDSIAAKEKADAEAKAQAEAAAASSAPASGSSGGSYSGSGYYGGGTSSGSYSGGTTGGYSGGGSYSGGSGGSASSGSTAGSSGSSNDGSYPHMTDSYGMEWVPLEGDSWSWTIDN